MDMILWVQFCTMGAFLGSPSTVREVSTLASIRVFLIVRKMFGVLIMV